MNKKMLVQKEVFVDEIQQNEGKIEEIMDDISDNGVIYFVNQENPPGQLDKPQFEVRAVLTPVDFNLTEYSDSCYETVMGEGGSCPFPLHLINSLGWKIGDNISFEETDIEGSKGIVLRRLDGK